ncbi:hypothetical protein BC828DRAFT_379647 [Blastocladiella britannica]|nr:hypothetical protein BC828DRAFT_379647 [Blastocladiella britannica]
MTVADAPPAHVHDAERGPVIEPASPVLPAPVPLSPHRRRRRRRHPPTRLVNREHAGSPAPNATPGAANSSTPTPSSAPLPRPSSSSYATVMASLSVTHQPLDDPPAHGRGASLIPAGASDWQHDSTMAAVRSAAYARARVARAIAATAAEADARAAMPPVIHMGAAGSAGKEDSKASKVQQQQQMLALARVRGTRATATSTTTASVLPIKSAGGSSSKWTGGISAAPSTGAPAVTETTLANVRGNREWARVAAHGAGLVCEPMSLGVHERLGPPRRDPALGGRRSPASGGEDATTPKVRVPPAAAVDPAAMDAWFAAHPHAHTRRSLSLSSSDSFAADDREDHDPEPWNPWTDAKLRARRCGGAGGQQWLGLVPVSPPPTNANTTEAYTGSTGNLWTGDMATSTAADPTSQRHSKPPIPGRTTTTSLQLTGTAQPWETLSMGALANAAAVPPSSFFGSSSSTGRDRPSTSPSPYPSTSSGDSAGSSSATTMGPVVRYANADANGLNAALPQLAVKRGLRNLWTAPAQCGPTGAGARGGGAQQPVAMVAALVVVSPARETWATGILATDSRGLDAIDEEDGVGDGDGEGYRGWANS